MSPILVYNMCRKDWPEVQQIYEQGIATGNATFELSVPEWQSWHTAHLPEPRIIAKIDNKVVGWAALSPVSDRCAYSGVAEVSVYVHQDFNGKGIGSELLDKLIELAEFKGLWTLQAGIFPENKASIHLHEKYGFRIVGIRKKLGKLNGVWRDVVMLERRSQVVGV